MKAIQRLILALLFITIMTMMAAACSNTKGTQELGDNDKVKVTVTTGMIADTVRVVGGDRVDVTGLMKEDVDPHVYKPTQGDIQRLEQADVIFYNGLYLEAQMGEVLSSMNGIKPVVAVAERIDPSKLLEGDLEQGEQYDPHVWFDVTLWMEVVEVIRDELAAFDPDHADIYRENAERYLQELDGLHEFAKERIAEIPKDRRYLVTAHDAFGYFGRAYDIEVVGLQGISTASEAGMRDVTELCDFLIEKGIGAIFVESSVSDNNIRAVQEGARSLGHEVKIGGELFSDSMGSPGTPEGTYVGMVRHNVNTIVDALK